MSDKLIEIATEVVRLTVDGELMSALTYYEENIRNYVADIEFHEKQELLEVMKSQADLIDDEDWQAVLENVERMEAILNA